MSHSLQSSVILHHAIYKISASKRLQIYARAYSFTSDVIIPDLLLVQLFSLKLASFEDVLSLMHLVFPDVNLLQ